MFEEVTTLIEDRMKSLWTATQVDYDNVEFNPVRGVSFVRLQIEWADTKNISVGGLDRGIGYLMISVFSPANTGSRACLGMADTAAGIFNKWQSGGLRFLVAKTQRIGNDREWYQVNVIIPFQYDECL